MIAELRRGGCPEEEIAKLAGQDGDGDEVEIWPENADAFRAFLFAATQWRTESAGMGGIVWLGIEHAAIERAFRLYPPKDEIDAWHAVGVLEAEALKVRNSKGPEDGN